MSLVNITDGTSNTLMFGESLGGTNEGPRDFNLAWMGAGALPTAWDLLDPCQWYSYGSNHTGVSSTPFATAPYACCTRSAPALPGLPISGSP